VKKERASTTPEEKLGTGREKHIKEKSALKKAEKKEIKLGPFMGRHCCFPCGRWLKKKGWKSDTTEAHPHKTSGSEVSTRQPLESKKRGTPRG